MTKTFATFVDLPNSSREFRHPVLTRTKTTSVFRKTVATFSPGAKTLPQKYFVSPDIFAEEKNKLFARHWVLVGHHSQIPTGGDYFVADVAHESLLIVRDEKCGMRAYHNICRHRGTRLKEHACGRAPAIQCPYHAWTYGLDGRLIGAPHMNEVPGFNKADYSLHPVKLELWEGFIFVNLAKNPMSLGEWLAPLAGKFSHWNMTNLRSVKRIEYDVRANWKLMFENYSECYHCPGVHPQLQKVSPSNSAENDLSEGPFLGGFMKIHRGKSLTMSGNACAPGIADSFRAPLSDPRPRGGRMVCDSDYKHKPDRKDQVFYYSIFPNMFLSMHPEYVMIHQLWPQSPERTLIVCNWLFHPDALGSSHPKFHPDDAIEFWDLTNKQDWHMCELSQQGIASRAYQPGPYSARESIPAAFDREYLRQMG